MKTHSRFFAPAVALALLAACSLPSQPPPVQGSNPAPAAPLASPASGPALTTNSFGMTFVSIPAGSFTMGSPESEQGRDVDERVHRVALTSNFLLQQTEVTQGHWKAVMGTNPSHFRNCGDDCPVEQVSWEKAQKFIHRLNELDPRLDYALPTEAQWEYAARAGSEGAYANGPLEDKNLFFDGNLEEMGWYVGNSQEATHPVGRKNPNAWGLYDMHGNVQEWTADWHAAYPFDPVNDPAGPTSGWSKIRRGGSWNLYDRFCRSAARLWSSPDKQDAFTGLRLAATAKKVKAQTAPADSDGDGVPDYRDKCPDTPRGVAVDENGCDLKLTIRIEFDFDKADIKPSFHAEIEKAAQFIRQHTGYKIQLSGHTDNFGSDDYNQTLSERRAQAVARYLVEKFNIDKKILFPRGYGEQHPVQTNKTDEGRQRNRRVEVICCSIIPH